MYKEFIDFVRKIYNKKEGFIPLHAPIFLGNEKKYVIDTIDSTFVSSVGEYVNRFEDLVSSITNSKYAIATVNGTLALHLGLVLVGVKNEDEVLTQSLSFVATSNAIRYCGADPVFIDVDKDTMGLSPISLKNFLEKKTIVKDKQCFNIQTRKKISACVPMHSFGFPCRIDEIVSICNEYFIPVVEDAAESMGSRYKDKHTGTFGKIGIFSFNGNKIVTCGGGGVIITDDEEIAKKAKHLSTTAKVPHSWDFFHDELGYNYRMPNLNAALACAQLEQLDLFVQKKRDLAKNYAKFFEGTEIQFVSEPSNSLSNYWLNTVLLNDKTDRDNFLKITNEAGIMTRPSWIRLNELPMYKNCYADSQENSIYLSERIVNIPSSVIL